MKKKNPPAFRTNKFTQNEQDPIKAKKAADYPPSMDNIPKQNNPQ
ncbi:hypothetical protein [Paenibacillus sp. GP183]|nr:hypothetical protein [Paenibacillus sp. GP183]